MEKTVSVATDFLELEPVKKVTFAEGTVEQMTGNPDLPNPTESLADVTTAANDLSAVNAKIAGGDRSKTTKNKQKLLADALDDKLLTNAHYVEDRARKLAAGNVTRAEEIINGSGYHVRGKGAPGAHGFEEMDEGEGWAKWRTVYDPEKNASGIIWRYGIAKAKNVPPDPDTLVTHHTPTLTVKISGFASGTIVAMQYAENELSGRLKRQTPEFNHNQPDPYEWSDFIYTVIP